MSALRDARLRRALDSAPDADLRPDQRTRKAVLEAAHKAVAPAPRAPWWAKLWQGMGDRAVPWNAALATVVIATLVTMLWYDREVPGVRPEVASTSEPAPAAQPPAAPSPAQPSVATAPPTVAPARKAAPATKPQPAPARPQQAESPRERRAEVAVDDLRDQQVRELAKSGPSPQSPAAAPAMSRAAPAGLASQAESRAAVNWTHLRIAAQGRSVELAREQAPRLAELLNAMIREAQSQQPLEVPVSMRIELMREAEPAGAIDLAGPQVRWTPAGRGGSFTARPDEARLQALRDEIGRLLQR
jgi:outer membrane biosynthesis protein TonB